MTTGPKRIETIRRCLGAKAVLIVVEKHTKKPKDGAWQKIGIESMSDPDYLARLEAADNIGVSLGEPSNGLRTTDFDDAEAMKEFCALNPALDRDGTLWTNRVRGGNCWIQIEGEAPESGILRDRNGKKIGEWRSTGNQTVISGEAIDRKKGETAPTKYRVISTATAPARLSFTEIKWPAGWQLPWVKPRTENRQSECRTKPSMSEIRSMLAAIPDRPEHDTWIKIIAAVRDGVSSDAEAIEILCEWSPEQELGEYAYKLEKRLKDVKVGTLIWMAKQHGWTGGNDVQSVDAYYDSERRLYLTRNARQQWLPINEDQFKLRLRAMGYRSGRPIEGERISPVDAALLYLQDHRDVRYAAPLAGRASGLYEENGIRLLVTESPRFIEPAEGSWDNVRCVLENLFVRSEPLCGQRQWHTILTWLKGVIEALRAGEFKEAQALAIAGPPCSGKSLLQKLVTYLLGGREAKPYPFMSGKTPFNGELFEAEHLILEDEHMSRKLHERLAFGSAIKAVVANESQHCHRKYCSGITLRPFWRLTITLNDEPEALLVLPPLDEHVADKILLLRASRHPLPMPTESCTERKAFEEQLMRELPAFIHFLLHEYQSPAELRDPRYVVAGWHHPELAEALHSSSPAAMLLGLIDKIAPWGTKNEWEGTAEQLRNLLLDFAGQDARRLLDWPQACGNYLATLAKKVPERVRPHRTNTARLWIIRSPISPGDGKTGVTVSLDDF